MPHESRGLGRGLQALLGTHPARAAMPGPQTNHRLLPIAAIQTGPSQPRKSIAQLPLEELAASIKANGVIQPIVVRPIPKAAADAPRYEIVAGERRWQAAKLAGLAEIPVVIRELSDQEAVAVALIENIQREELTPAEEARSLKRLIEEFTLTHQEVATAVGRSRAAVSNLIRLLDLPSEVVALIDAKTISMGHARALLGLDDDGERLRLGRLIAERGSSVRETETLVRRALKGEGAEAPKKPPELNVVSEVLKTPFVHVSMQQKASGMGRLIVEFKDSATRDEIIGAIKGVVDDR
jgi:ParB family transcriptional regulator, chromosome partitioning protein